MNYDEANYVFLDTETSSIDANRGVVEIAWVRTDDDFNILEQVQSLINPQQLISAAASGIHGLTNKDVSDAPTIKEFLQQHPLPDNLVLLGHNVNFDTHSIKHFIPGAYVEACSLRWVRRVYPEVDDYKLSTLIFALDLPRSHGAHRAMADVMSTYHLTKHLCERTGLTLKQYAQSAQETYPLHKVPFGKYKGESFTSVPTSYLSWMRGNLDLDGDLEFTVKRELNRRRVAA